jgi:hypothetical protein
MLLRLIFKIKLEQQMALEDKELVIIEAIKFKKQHMIKERNGQLSL